MKPKIAITIILVLTAILPQIVAAVAPTLDWIITYEPGDQTNQASAPYGAILAELNANNLDVDTLSRVAVPLHYGDAGLNDFDTTIKVVDVSGSPVFQESHTCPLRGGNDVCLQRAVKWDRANRLSAVLVEDHATGNPAGSIGDDPGNVCRKTTTIGGSICAANWNISANSDAVYGATQISPGGLTFTKNASTSQWPIVQTGTGTNKLIRVPESFTGTAEYSSTRAGRGLLANDTGPTGWSFIFTAGSSTFRRLNFTDGTQEESASFAEAGWSGPQRVFWLNDDEVINVYTESNALRWRRAEAYALTVSSTTDPTDNQIFEAGAVRNTAVYDFDTDRQNGVLACGQYVSDTAEVRGWFGHFSATTDAQLWNVTLDLGTQTEVVSCRLDHQNGIYVLVAYVDGGIRKAQLRHYLGGEFEIKAPWETITIPGATTTTAAPAVGGAVGFRDFCTAVGFTDAPGKFLCGLVIVLTGSVLVAFILANRNDKGMARLGNVSLFGAGGTFFGLAIFVTVIDLWPTYTTIIMIILTAAVVTLVIKRQFISGGGD